SADVCSSDLVGGGPARGCGQGVGLLGVVGVLAHGGGDLLGGGGGLGQGAGLLLGARRQVQVAGGDLGRGRGDGVCAAADLADDFRQMVTHVAQGKQQAG